MTPFPFRWDGEHMIPLNSRWSKEADRAFVVGEVYRMEAVQERSAASHKHYFACLNEAWNNLPEDLASRFPSAEHLRKYALIRTGFAAERSIVCASPAEAERVAAFVKPMDEFAVVLICDAVVKVFTAESQSMRAMGKDRFQRSKDAVLEFISARVGVKRNELEAAEIGRAHV